MDNGGSSMLPFAPLCRNMVAGLKKELRNIKEFYFHNTIYEDLFTNERFTERITLDRFLQENPRSLLIFIGDAAMAPSELFSAYGSLQWDEESPEPSFNQTTNPCSLSKHTLAKPVVKLPTEPALYCQAYCRTVSHVPANASRAAPGLQVFNEKRSFALGLLPNIKNKFLWKSASEKPSCLF